MFFFAVISCGPLSVTASTLGGLTLQFSAPSTQFRTKAVYSCRNNDYQIVGVAERVCGADGNWTGEEPHCEGQ